MILLWLTRWATRRQSEIAAIIGVLGVAGWSLAQANPAVALLACTAAAITGGYTAFFHSVKTMVLNFVVGMVVAGQAAVRLARETGLVNAATAFWVIWFLNVAVPVAIRGVSRAMGRYATASYEDPLTGLLNRRGFIKFVTRQLANPPITDTRLIVAMIDVDDFKGVNDTHGHTFGDRALIAVADLLRGHSPPTAVICRPGGEEFLIALTTKTDLPYMATTLGTAIAELSHQITASIGTAAVPLDKLSQPVGADAIEQIISDADAAMYTAKRNGGNQVHHS